MLQNRVFILQNRDFPLHISEIMPIFAVNKRRIVGVVMMLSSDNSPKKSWRPKKKNFFVRLGETGDPVHFSK